MDISVSFFTEIVAAGEIENCDILGLDTFDFGRDRGTSDWECHRAARHDQRQGHATTSLRSWRAESAFQQKNITIEEGDTDTASYGLGTCGSRSTPVAGAATAMAGRKIRAKAKIIAAYLLEVHDDLGWDVDSFCVKGVPEMSKTMTELAFRLQQRPAGGIVNLADPERPFRPRSA